MKKNTKKPIRTNRASAHVRDYETIRPLYLEFGNRLTDLLRDLLENSAIRFQTIEHRAKDVASFRGKLRRPGKNYSDPLNEMDDLCGLRIIVYYPEDTIRVADLIRKEFNVNEAHSVDKASELGVQEFGYSSIHLVAALSSERAMLMEWSRFSKLRAEIQIRTVLQHAWAAISHALDYKNEADVPRSLRRRLFRLSGLLELADQEFAVLRIDHEAIKQKIESSTDKVLRTATIDRVSLNEFLSRSEKIGALTKKASEAGFTLSESKEDDVAELARICSQARIATIQELEDSLSRIEPRARSYFAKAYQNSKYAGWEGSPSFFLLLAIILAHIDRFNLKILHDNGWDEDNAKAILEAAKEFRVSTYRLTAVSRGTSNEDKKE